MLRQIFNFFLLLGLLNLSLPGIAKAPVNQNSLSTNHSTSSSISTSATTKTDDLIISLAEDAKESTTFSKVRKSLIVFLSAKINSATNYSLAALKESPINNHLPIYIITHDYRV